MGIFKKDTFDVGEEISYQIKDTDNIPEDKKRGDTIKGKIKKIKGDKVDIEWENGDIDSGVDIKKLQEDINIIKYYFDGKKEGVYNFFEYKIKKIRRGNVIILEGYNRKAGRVFKIVRKDYIEDFNIKMVLSNFMKYLENTDLKINDEVIKKYSLKDLFIYKMVNDEEEYKEQFFKYGKDKYKNNYAIGEYIIDYFVGLDDSGNQIICYKIGKK